MYIQLLKQKLEVIWIVFPRFLVSSTNDLTLDHIVCINKSNVRWKILLKWFNIIESKVNYYAKTKVVIIIITGRRRNKIESTNTNNNIATDRHYPKLSKAASGYLEIELFKNVDMHTGYFCYNCVYFIKENHCALVQNGGADINGKVSGMIAPYGVCSLWVPNEHETR